MLIIAEMCVLTHLFVDIVDLLLFVQEKKPIKKNLGDSYS